MRKIVNYIFVQFLIFFWRKKIKISNSKIGVKVLFKDIKLSRKHPVRIMGSTIGTGFSCLEGCLIANSNLYGNIKLGRFVSLNGGLYASDLSGIEIGSFSSIAPNVLFFEHLHRMDKISTYYMNRNIFKSSRSEDTFTKGKIIVEEDVWIGANSVILSGVTIGRGSVIGAGSIVSKDIPRYSIVLGAPAKVIRSRFQINIINQLEESKWWLWDIEKIIENKEAFNKNLFSEDSAIFDDEL